MSLPEIPNTWLIAILLAGLIVMRIFSIDSWTTATLGVIIGYITGSHIQAGNQLGAVSTAAPIVPLSPPAPISTSP
jgi:hypothetical protein